MKFNIAPNSFIAATIRINVVYPTPIITHFLSGLFFLSKIN